MLFLTSLAITCGIQSTGVVTMAMETVLDTKCYLNIVNVSPRLLNYNALAICS